MSFPAGSAAAPGWEAGGREAGGITASSFIHSFVRLLTQAVLRAFPMPGPASSDRREAQTNECSAQSRGDVLETPFCHPHVPRERSPPGTTAERCPVIRLTGGCHSQDFGPWKSSRNTPLFQELPGQASPRWAGDTRTWCLGPECPQLHRRAPSPGPWGPSFS